MKKLTVLLCLFCLAGVVWATGQQAGGGDTDAPMDIEFMRGIGNALIPDPAEDVILQGLNEALNINLTLTGVATEYAQQVNVRIAGGNYPDCFANPGRSYFVQYANDGVLMNISPYDSQIPHFLKMNPDAEKLGVLEGNRYAMATNLGINYGAYYIRKDWLDKLGLDVPESLDEYMAVCKAFTEQDPDGNGKKDTYGFSANGQGGLATFFTAFGVGRPGDLFVQDGKLMVSHESERSKEAIAWLKDFLASGVVDPNIIAIKKDAEVRQKMAQQMVGLVWSSWPAMRKPNFAKELNSVNPDSEWLRIDPPIGPHGDQLNGVHSTLGARIYYSVPSVLEKDAARRDKVLEIVDYCASEPGYRLTSFGLEGTHYTVDNGTIVATEQLFQDGTYFWVYQFGGRKEVEYLMTKFSYAADEIEANGNAPKIESLNNGIDIPKGYNHADANRYLNEEILKFMYGNRDLSEYDDFIKTLNTTFDYTTYKEAAETQLKALGIIN